MRWPLDKFTITQTFYSPPGHGGTDLAAPQGTPVKAPENGVIDGRGDNPNYIGGNYITIKGDSGRRFYMGHHSVNRASIGQRVSEGQHIADVGMTGQATGPHVHFQIWNSAGQLVDPQGIIKQGEIMEKINNNTARILGYHLLGRNQLVGRNSLDGSDDGDLNKYQVGQNLTNEHIFNLYQSPEATRYRDEVIPNIIRERDINKQAVEVLNSRVVDKDKEIKELNTQLALQSDDTKLLNSFGEVVKKLIVRFGLKGVV